MIRRLATLVVVLTVASSAFAAKTVRGKVTDATTSSPYAGVAVALESSSAGRSATVYTNDGGLFYFRDVPAGTYTLEVKTARSTKRVTVSVGGGELSDLPEVTVP